METLYRKVAVSENEPIRGGDYFTDLGRSYFNSKTHKWEDYYEDGTVYPEWWLEEIPDPTTQLKADKVEMLEMLEEMYSKYEKDGHLLNVSPSKIESLIQKHKQ